MAYTTIDDSSAHFQIVTYTGNESGQSITNVGNSDLQPDLVWIKNRGDAHGHQLQDSTRGVGKAYEANNTDAEQTGTAAQNFTAFNSDGFSLGAGHQKYNDQDDTYVAFQWKANGGSTSSNTTGDITSAVQANTTAGFSIITYTGNATDGQTVGHGLGVKPDIIFAKGNHGDYNWNNRHTALESSGNGYVVHLDLASGAGNEVNKFTATAPTTAVFSLGDHGTNISGTAQVAYCWFEVQGFSKFGSYEGNGADDGAFIYTGFKPALVIQKQTSADGEWWMMKNSATEPYNQTDANLYPNASNAEGDTNGIDLLSNGFKCRTDGAGSNADGATYIYMAWAEEPFVTSGGVPCTAK